MSVRRVYGRKKRMAEDQRPGATIRANPLPKNRSKGAAAAGRPSSLGTSTPTRTTNSPVPALKRRGRGGAGARDGRALQLHP
jgi:hypothetical protein